MVSTRDLMWALAQAYLTGREMGESEAYYKLEPSLHYKQTNVKTVFITSGFPQNRWQFLRKYRYAIFKSINICFTVLMHFQVRGKC